MARVFTPTDWLDLGLPGRTSKEIVSSRTGAQSGTVRYVEIPVPVHGEPLRQMHVHHGVEEVIYVLDGEGSFETPSTRFRVSPGDVTYVPADEPHVTRNTSNVVLRLLCFFPHSKISTVTTELGLAEDERKED